MSYEKPSDSGTIDGRPVVSVRRDGNEAVHLVCSRDPLTPGAQVLVAVDWNKRFDHMQQHSGQHLITAVADQTFSLATTSWNLGEQVSYIELDANTISDETIDKLELIVNEKIRASLPVSIDLLDENDEQLAEVRSRMDLPADQRGPIRVITIEGVDRNTCCGTHVSNLSHLQVLNVNVVNRYSIWTHFQAIKLLYTEKGKKNKTNLYFIAGNRVLSYLDKCVKRDKLLTTVLKLVSFLVDLC